MDIILVTDCPDSATPFLKQAFSAGYRTMTLVEINGNARVIDAKRILAMK